VVIVNRTPHAIRLYRPDGPDVVDNVTDGLIEVIPPTDPPIRIAMIELGTQPGGIELVEFGHAHRLPVKRSDVQLVVSLVVALACHGREDLLFPYREVRDRNGTVVGCRQFGSVC
jgi:hypothetical protein